MLLLSARILLYQAIRPEAYRGDAALLGERESAVRSGLVRWVKRSRQRGWRCPQTRALLVCSLVVVGSKS